MYWGATSHEWRPVHRRRVPYGTLAQRALAALLCVVGVLYIAALAWPGGIPAWLAGVLAAVPGLSLAVSGLLALAVVRSCGCYGCRGGGK